MTYYLCYRVVSPPGETQYLTPHGTFSTHRYAAMVLRTQRDLDNAATLVRSLGYPPVFTEADEKHPATP